MPTDLDLLVEMGFARAKAEKALLKTNSTGLQSALEWLTEHEEEEVDGDSEDPKLTDDGNKSASSYKCEDCGKLIRSNDEVQLHSARTGHVNFAESTDEIKPLTEEEKRAQVEKLQEIMRQKKLQRQEQEKQDELEREKVRRKQGKTLGSAKAKFEEDEMRRLVEERRREKEEDKLYKEQLKAQIAQDRADKLARDRGEPVLSAVVPQAAPPATSNPCTSTGRPDPTNCRLNIRLPSGSALTGEFSPQEPLSAVILYITQKWDNPPVPIYVTSLSVSTNFPKRQFLDEDLQLSLSTLGLCPSATLFVKLRT